MDWNPALHALSLMRIATMFRSQSRDLLQSMSNSQLTETRPREENEIAKQKKAQYRPSRTKTLRASVAKAVGRTKNSSKSSSADKASATPEPNTSSFDVKETLRQYKFGGVPSTAPLLFPEVAQPDVITVREPFQSHGYHSSVSSLASTVDSEYSDFSITDTSRPTTPRFYSHYEDSYTSASTPALSYEDVATPPRMQVPGLVRSHTSPYVQQTPGPNTPLRQGRMNTPALTHHHSYSHSVSHSHSHTVSGLAYPSYVSQKPSGLCLYIPGVPLGGPSTFAPSSTYTASTPTSPQDGMTAFSVRAPLVYQGGPIDWNSRPLAPFASKVSIPPSPALSIDASEGQQPYMAHTVCMDQIYQQGSVPGY
jgi:hypothetical protein